MNCFSSILPRMLCVDRVVIHNNSCSSELDRHLKVSIQEGFVEMVPRLIDNRMVLSRGWLHSEM